MRLRHIAALGVVSLLAFAATAADVETPLSPIRNVPAAFAQTEPAVASNGREFLAAWIDSRSKLTAESVAPRELWVTRLDVNGHPVEAFGHRIATDASAPLIASSGSGYLVVWKSRAGFRARRLDDDGNPIGTERGIAGHTPALALVSNGSTFLFVYEGERSTATAIILDANGSVTATVASQFKTFGGVAVRGHDYLIVDATGECTDLASCGNPRLTTVSGSSVLSQVTIPATLPPNTALSVASSTDGTLILLAWHSFNGPSLLYSYALVRFDGRVYFGPRDVILPAAYSIGEKFVSAWDGNEFLLIVAGNAASRISNVGHLIDPAPFEFAAKKTKRAFATNGTSTLMAWSDRRGGAPDDLFARAVRSFDEIAAAPFEAEVATYSAAAQLSVKAARAAGHTLAVWDSHSEAIEGSLDGRPITIAAAGDRLQVLPTVGASQDMFLVVWWTLDPPELGSTYDYTTRGSLEAAPLRLVGKRVAADGTVLDGQPLRIATDASARQLRVAYGIASDGNDFLVVHGGAKTEAIRVSRSGAVAFPVTIFASPLPGTSARAVWTGTQFFIGDSFDGAIHSQLNPGQEQPITLLGGTPFGTTIAAIDGAQHPLVYENGFLWATRLSMTWTGARVTYAWGSESWDYSDTCTWIAQFSPAGAQLLAPTAIHCMRRPPAERGPHSHHAEVAWDGQKLIVAWSEQTGGGSRVLAMRLNPNGQKIDAEPFQVSLPGDLAADPAFVPAESGVLIAYSKIDGAAGGVARGYMRPPQPLTDQPSPPPPPSPASGRRRPSRP